MYAEGLQRGCLVCSPRISPLRWQLRVYNYNTLDKVHAWEAHQDYIRSVAIHPSQPFVISSSDDMQIKLWDWEKNWQCTRTFEGHSHYVMQVCFNPKVRGAVSPPSAHTRS